MAARILKGITGRWKSCVFLLSALVEQGTEIAAAQLQSVTPHLEDGDTDPDFWNPILGRARRLKASMLRLVDADHKLYAQKALLTSLRAARAQGISLVAAAIVDMRRFVLFHYEEPDMVALALHSPREYQPEPLFRQALLIDETFQRDGLEKLLGKRRYDGVDPKAPAAAVAQTVAGLRGTLDDIYKARRHLDVAQVEKDEAQTEHDELFIYTARSFEADCRLAGKKELAKRVRPSEKRPGETEVAPPDNDLPLPQGDDVDPLPLSELPALSLEESQALTDSD